MNQVHRLFNTYIWSTSTENPHRHQVHQAEVYLWITVGRKGLLSRSTTCAKLREGGRSLLNTVFLRTSAQWLWANEQIVGFINVLFKRHWGWEPPDKDFGPRSSTNLIGSFVINFFCVYFLTCQMDEILTSSTLKDQCDFKWDYGCKNTLQNKSTKCKAPLWLMKLIKQIQQDFYLLAVKLGACNGESRGLKKKSMFWLQK